MLCCLLYVYGGLVDGAEELADEAFIKAAGTPLLQTRLQELTVAIGLDDGQVCGTLEGADALGYLHALGEEGEELAVEAVDLGT